MRRAIGTDAVPMPRPAAVRSECAGPVAIDDEDPLASAHGVMAGHHDAVVGAGTIRATVC